ncbi:hypothetical protein BGZ89_009328 [Linnemannia elongata]|nr:hypothetical protein BGZ89_009328 [Linnemannia elongata]
MTGKGKRTDLHGLQEENQVDKFHPFNYIFQALFDIHYGRQMTIPREPSNLTVLQQKLFQFICNIIYDRQRGLDRSKTMFFGDQYHKLYDLVADNNFSVPQDWLMEVTSAVCKSKLCEPEMVKRPKETESMTVKIWHEVFEILFDKTNVSVQT